MILFRSSLPNYYYLVLVVGGWLSRKWKNKRVLSFRHHIIPRRWNISHLGTGEIFVICSRLRDISLFLQNITFSLHFLSWFIARLRQTQRIFIILESVRPKFTSPAWLFHTRRSTFGKSHVLLRANLHCRQLQLQKFDAFQDANIIFGKHGLPLTYS